MNQQQASGAEEAVKGAHAPDAKPSGQAGAQGKGPVKDDKEGRLRKAYSKVKDALKNSRHV